MADIAAALVDDLLPEAPYRQWVLTFPWAVRFRLAVDRALFSKLLGIFLRTVFAWQRQRGRALGIRTGHTGAVTFVQRFGGALNLNPHIHRLLPDGLFVSGASADAPLVFVPLPEPASADIEGLTHKIAARLTSVIERAGADAGDTDAALERTAAAIRVALAAALEPPLPKLGLELLDHTSADVALCAKIAGFSLHAARVVPAHDRDALEKLCRYGLRPPFSQERLSSRSDGRILYHLRKPWPNAQGANCLVLEPSDFLRRLAALVPAPYTNLVRYHGVFAGRSRCRKLLPKPPRKTPGDRAESRPEAPNAPAAQVASSTPAVPSTDAPNRTRRRSIPWAQLLLRVFHLDALACPRCATPMVVLAFLSDPNVVRKILLHLGLPADVPPTAPPRQHDEPLFDDHFQTGAKARSPP